MSSIIANQDSPSSKTLQNGDTKAECEEISLKRKSIEKGNIQKTMKMTGFDPSKNPVQQLHELYTGVTYEFEQEG